MSSLLTGDCEEGELGELTKLYPLTGLIETALYQGGLHQ